MLLVMVVVRAQHVTAKNKYEHEIIHELHKLFNLRKCTWRVRGILAHNNTRKTQVNHTSMMVMEVNITPIGFCSHEEVSY